MPHLTGILQYWSDLTEVVRDFLVNEAIGLILVIQIFDPSALSVL